MCVKAYALLCEPWGWVEKKRLDSEGGKDEAKINKKCAINEMKCGGREMPGSEI